MDGFSLHSLYHDIIDDDYHNHQERMKARLDDHEHFKCHNKQCHE